MNKAEVARRQLGVALDMFLRGQDPVSVHCLAMGGGEVAEFLAEAAGGKPFKNHILDTFPDMNIRDIRVLQRKSWNAFKHATTQKGIDRDDADVLEAFDPTENEHTLLIGWWDYGAAGLPRPIEAQAFEGWYMAKYPEKADPAFDMGPINRLFPELAGLSSGRQHARLVDVIRKAKKNGAVMNDPGTDRRTLVLPWGLSESR